MTIIAKFLKKLIKNGGERMTNENNSKVTVETTVHAPVEKVWKYWTEPDHITKWNSRFR